MSQCSVSHIAPKTTAPRKSSSDAGTIRKGESMTDRHQRIKWLLAEWAAWTIDRYGKGYPSQAPFASIRVDGGNRSTDTFLEEAPAEVIKLNEEIERLAPAFKRIVAVEFCDRRPQKTKASIIGIPRQIYNQRVRWILEQLDYAMFGA